MPDPIFAEPRLAELYDPLERDRPDLDAYVAIVDELGASSVLDVGCGTGTLACLLAERGISVTGVDPAAASLDVARRKPGAERVRWIHGDATGLPPMQVDAATMTGNAAATLLTDDELAGTLAGVRAALRPGGTFAFEVRDPAREAWREWTREHWDERVDVAGVGPVRHWVDLLEVDLPLVTFRWTFVFEADGAELTSDSTLRFWTEDEVRAALDAGGYVVRDLRDAPDRPGNELVFLAERS